MSGGEEVPKPPVRRKAIVKGPSTPYVHALYHVTGSIDLAVLFQQVAWLSEEFGDDEGWAFFSLDSISATIGPRKSTIDRWMKRLIDLGLVERNDWKDDLKRFAYRPNRTRLHQLAPHLRLRDGRWNGTTPSSQNGTTPPLHDTDPATSSTRARTQDVDVDREGEEDNGNYQHVGSEERLGDNRGRVWKATQEHVCSGCGDLIPHGADLLRDGHRRPFHPACLPKEVRVP